MSYGLEVNNAAGQERLGAGSFIHRLMVVGTAMSGTAYTEVFIAFSGMTLSDEWFVITGGAFPSRVDNGGFYVKNLQYPSATQFWYSVYRR